MDIPDSCKKNQYLKEHDEGESENVWKTEFGFTTPYARFYENDINEAKYVGSFTGTEVIAGFKTDGTLYATTGSITAEEMREGILAKKNNDTTASSWITVYTNYVIMEQFENGSLKATYKYEIKDDGKFYVYMNNNEMVVGELVTE